MSNISVTTTQNVIAVTESGGITVTTPEGQTIDVTVPNSSVNVTNTTDDITILTAGTLIIQAPPGTITSVNGQTGPVVVLDTDDISEGTTNKYFSQALARQSLSAGTGISYDSGTGVITNTSINTNTTYTIDATTATGGANFNLVGSDSSTDTIKIASGTNITVSRTDANTITIDGSDLNTTYTIASASTTGGANLNLVGSDSSTDSVAYKGSGATTVTSTDANTITIASTDTNTTYTQNASAATGGANLNLVGSDSTTDTIKFAEGTGITVVRTDADTITITNTVPDTNTTYTQNISSTTGGTNLNLVGSDSTTDTVKFANGTGVTVAYTDTNTATVSIGQSVGTGDSPSFAGGTFGNITVGVDTDNTIGTTDTNGNIILDPNGTGNVVITLADDGNLTNSRNYVAGAIRNTFAEAAGNIFSFSTTAAGGPTQGISLDNSINTTKRPGVVLRAYGAGLGSGNPVATFITETARGSAATPTGLASGNGLGSFLAGGYADTSVSGTGAGWVSDTTGNTVGSIGFQTTEAWTGGTGAGSPLGTRVRISTNPTGSANAVQTSLEINPQSTLARSDSFTWSNGKTNSTQKMALDVNGNLTLTASDATTTTLRVGDVNIAEMNSTWQTALTPGFKYTGLMSSSTQTVSGSTFEMSSRWKASSGTSTYDPPQLNWGLGKFTFSADNSTTNTSQVNAGSFAAVASENWTNLSTGSRIKFEANKQGSVFDSKVVLSMSPETATFASDVFTFEGSTGTDYLTIDSSGNVAITGTLDVQGGTITDSTGALTITSNGSFTSTGSSISGTTLTIGTLSTGTISIGQSIHGGTVLTNTVITANISGSGSGSTWTVSKSQTVASSSLSGAGNITLDPITTGDISFILDNGGNLINSRNYVYGAIRNATTETNGDHWNTFAGTGYRGVTLDNSIDTTKRPGMAIRSYGISGGAPRTGIIFEGARGTAASPSNLNSGDIIGDIFANGYTSTGWASDQVAIVPGIARFYTTEAWNDGLNKTGTGFRVLLQPTATTLSTTSLVTALEVRAEQTTVQKLFTVANNRSTGSNDFATINFSTQKFTSPNFIPTSNGDRLGEFKFNGNTSSGSSSSPGAPAAQIGAQATEDWTSAANGTKFYFLATKTGTLTQVPVITGGSESTVFNSDSYTFADSAGTNISGGKIVYGRQYIEAYSTADQTNPVANAENLMSFNNTGINNGISIVTNGTTLTRITMANAGIYNIQFSAQLSQTSGGNHNAFIWLKKNGTTVANTAGDVKVAGNGDRIMASWNYIVSATASDYYELAWAATDTSVVLDYVAASAPIPAIPSVILTVVPVGA